MIKVTTAHKALIAVLSLGALAACGRTGMSADNRVCTPFPSTQGASAANTAGITVTGGEAANFDDCLHRWSYRLAGSPDPAEQVGRAVVQACGDNLSRWNTEGMNASGPAQAPAFDLTTGRPMTPVEQHYQYAQGKALFYVVQARAGHCAAPTS